MPSDAFARNSTSYLAFNVLDVRLAQLIKADVLHHSREADKPGLERWRQGFDFGVNATIKGFDRPSHGC